MITYKTEEEIKVLREGGKRLAHILDSLRKDVCPGITTGELEKKACRLIKEIGGKPAFKGYRSRYDNKAFPTALCTSINDEIVHAPALPSRKLNEGDIIGIDIGMMYPYKAKGKNYYTDMAITVGVGNIGEVAKKLINVTKKSLEMAIKKVGPGKKLFDIGETVEKYVEGNGYGIVRELVGHGVGFDVHEEPQVPNYKVTDKSIDNIKLRPGMVIAIEPMVNIGDYRIKGDDDGFSIRTKDGSLSAHFEHTVAVTENGYLIITEL